MHQFKNPCTEERRKAHSLMRPQHLVAKPPKLDFSHTSPPSRTWSLYPRCYSLPRPALSLSFTELLTFPPSVAVCSCVSSAPRAPSIFLTHSHPTARRSRSGSRWQRRAVGVLQAQLFFIVCVRRRSSEVGQPLPWSMAEWNCDCGSRERSGCWQQKNRVCQSLIVWSLVEINPTHQNTKRTRQR